MLLASGHLGGINGLMRMSPLLLLAFQRGNRSHNRFSISLVLTKGTSCITDWILLHMSPLFLSLHHHTDSSQLLHPFFLWCYEFIHQQILSYLYPLFIYNIIKLSFFFLYYIVLIILFVFILVVVIKVIFFNFVWINTSGFAVIIYIVLVLGVELI